MSWEIHYGAIPDGQDILHRCDTPACVRPDHLFLGTDVDNVADKVAKGRQPHGEHTGHAKLTNALAIELRQRWAAGGVKQKDLCAEYGVSASTMSTLLSGKRWTHIPT